MEDLKEHIRSYWTRRAPSFTKQRLREWKSAKRALWQREFARYLSAGKKLRVLDAGTGTGFFACLLAAGGHEVTGIDFSEKMIHYAETSARALKVTARFLVMDAEVPDFPPSSFDAIVTRNLTWTLPHLDEAYRAWYRLLAPGGVLINFDADYCRDFSDAEDLSLLPDHAHKQIPAALLAEGDEITQEMCAYQQKRPEWDVRLLLDAGFSQIRIDAAAGRRIYAEKDEFYNPVAVFALVAHKE